MSMLGSVIFPVKEFFRLIVFSNLTNLTIPGDSMYPMQCFVHPGKFSFSKRFHCRAATYWDTWTSLPMLPYLSLSFPRISMSSSDSPFENAGAQKSRQKSLVWFDAGSSGIEVGVPS